MYKRGEYDHAIAILRLMIERHWYSATVGDYHSSDGDLHYLLFECDVKKQNQKEAVEELERTLTLGRRIFSHRRRGKRICRSGLSQDKSHASWSARSPLPSQ